MPGKRLPDEQLLKRRLSSLRVTVEGTWLEDCLEALHEELEERGIRLRPHAWISSEWFSPDNTPGIAIPFYLAHPRLMKLEKKMISTSRAAPGPSAWPFSVMRRAIPCSMPISCIVAGAGSNYSGRPRNATRATTGPIRPAGIIVQHLRLWYAQSHPDEDFAETFAVWLQPRSNWRTRYAGWPALKKLEYVDELMDEIAGKRPLLTGGSASIPALSSAETLAEHYKKKQALYAFDTPKTYDRDLSRLFSADPRHRRSQPASVFIRRHRASIRELVAKWTGENQLTLDAVLDDMIARCREQESACGRFRAEAADRFHRAVDRQDNARTVRSIAAQMDRAMKRLRVLVLMDPELVPPELDQGVHRAGNQ